jgi:uncharacterized alpha/beta hydrolase family protein
MRISHFASIPKSVQEKSMVGGQALVKSLASMRNFLQQTDRQTEMPIMLKAGSGGSSEMMDPMLDAMQNEGNQGFMMANILTNNIIGDAMELIEEDNAPNDEDMSRD